IRRAARTVAQRSEIEPDRAYGDLARPDPAAFDLDVHVTPVRLSGNASECIRERTISRGAKRMVINPGARQRSQPVIARAGELHDLEVRFDQLDRRQKLS